MAKGQKRGNREVRKPKATKKPAEPPATFLGAKARPGSPAVPGKKA